MNGALPIVLIVLMVAVLAVLMTGVISMAVGGEFNRRFGNRLMRARVILQLVAVAVFVLLVLAVRSGGS